MMPEKDYIKTLRFIRHNYERDWHFCWDDMSGEYKNAIEAIDKAIEALQDKELHKHQITKPYLDIDSHIPFYRCGNCDEPIERFHIYCWNCGKKIDWDDKD